MKKIITVLLLSTSLVVVGSSNTKKTNTINKNKNKKVVSTVKTSSKSTQKSSKKTTKQKNTSSKSSNRTIKKESFSTTSNINTLGMQTGIASFYGGKWHGRKTANGEIYNQNTLTAAHKTLPFNTKVKVTNVNNGKSVIVRINNRGPYAKGRIIDLSRAAFSSIASLNQGITRVKLEVLN